MTFSGTASIHAIILAVVSKNSLPDLDAFAIWAIVSAGCLVTLPVVEFSKTLRESPAKPVFKLWGLLVFIGSVCSVVACLRRYPEEKACWSEEGVLLREQTQANMGRLNCTYSCFSSTQTLRSGSEIIVLTKGFLGLRGRLIMVLLIRACPFYLVTLFCFLWSGRRRSFLSKSLSKDDSAATRESQKTLEKRMEYELSLRTGGYKEEPSLLITRIFSIVLFFLLVCFNEMFMFMDGGLPVTEKAYAVGQWSGWVSTILVIIASAIVRKGVSANQGHPPCFLPLLRHLK